MTLRIEIAPAALAWFGLLSALTSVSRADIRYREVFVQGCICAGCQDCNWITDNNSQMQICGQGLYGAYFHGPDTYVSLPGHAAVGLNELGHVIGWGYADTQGWFWSPEDGAVGLGFLEPGPNAYTMPAAINDFDEVVGYSRYDSGIYRAFIWRPDVGIALLDPNFFAAVAAIDINNSGWVLFDANDPVVWTPQDGPFFLTGAPDLELLDARAMNNLGQVVGRAATPAGQAVYTWDPVAGYRNLGRFGSPMQHTTPFDINDAGQVVGVAEAFYGGFLWDPLHGMRRLTTILDPCAQGSLLYFHLPATINNRGEIAGPNSGILRPYIPGDLDEDGEVELGDLAALLANFGTRLPHGSGPAPYVHGNLDCDRDVDLTDLATLLANFGETLP
jgi:hypothetical protein